jgi:hypothetical protein
MNIFFKIILMMTCLVINPSNAESMKDFLNPQSQKNFYGTSNNVISQEKVVPLNVSLVKKGECLKFKKDGEQYWNKYETEILKIQEIGDHSLKVQRIIFVNTKTNQWMGTKSFKLDFEHQMKYDLFPCPLEEDSLSEKEIFDIKAKLKR